MNSTNGKFNFVIILLGAVMMYGMVLISGCGSDTTTNTTPTVTDTNVVLFDSVMIGFSTSVNGVNLWKGSTTTAGDPSNDITLGGNTNNFIQSSANPTFFSLVDSNISNAQFDTLSVIPSSGTIDPETFFTKSETSSYGLFTVPLTANPVYGFYIKGKSGNGTTGGVKVYGVIYIKRGSNAGPSGNLYQIRIKLNKAGLNKFKK